MQFLLAPQGEGDDQDRTHWRNVQQLAMKHDAESFEEIKQYVLEAQRLNFDIPLVRHFTEPSPSDKSYDRLKPAIELANSFYSPSTEESNGANGHAPNGNAVSVKPRPTEHQFLLEIVSVQISCFEATIVANSFPSAKPQRLGPAVVPSSISVAKTT